MPRFMTPPSSQLVRAVVEEAHEPYGRVFDCPHPELIARVVESRLGSDAPGDPLEDLVRATPAQVRRWMEEAARNADRCAVAPVLADPGSILLIIDEMRAADPFFTVPGRKRRTGGWDIVRSGLLRMLCGLSLAEVGSRTGCSMSAAQVRVARFRRLLTEDRGVADRASRILHEALSRDMPGPVAPPTLLRSLASGAGRA